MKIKHSEPYASLRAQTYPAIGEQLDAIMKMAEALQSQGISLPQETQEWVSNCLAVKERYKKPVSK